MLDTRFHAARVLFASPKTSTPRRTRAQQVLADEMFHAEDHSPKKFDAAVVLFQNTTTQDSYRQMAETVLDGYLN